MTSPDTSETTEVLLGSDLMEHASKQIKDGYRGNSISASRGNQDTSSLFNINYPLSIGRNLRWVVQHFKRLYIPSRELYLYNTILLGISGGQHMWGLVINREQLESITHLSIYSTVLQEDFLIALNNTLLEGVLKVNFRKVHTVAPAGKRSRDVI
ncbi:hypothetical protein ACFLY9_01050 [Patescibacteria group bacterium]